MQLHLACMLVAMHEAPDRQCGIWHKGVLVCRSGISSFHDLPAAATDACSFLPGLCSSHSRAWPPRAWSGNCRRCPCTPRLLGSCGNTVVRTRGHCYGYRRWAPPQVPLQVQVQNRRWDPPRCRDYSGLSTDKVKNVCNTRCNTENTGKWHRCRNTCIIGGSR